MTKIGTVTVVGLGLIGGSFALGLRRIGYQGRILGVSSPSALKKALECGVIDEAKPIDEALPISDLVYIAKPVQGILDILPEISKHVPQHALVTDAGSVKHLIVECARSLFPENGPCFVGGHPMAGKEKRGVELADAELFRNATYVLTPTGNQLPVSPEIDEFCSWLDAMGCKQKVMDAAHHDLVVAWTSHLPQLVSTALAATINDQIPVTEDLAVAGEGLRDMTRLAASSHEIWSDIISLNCNNLNQALGVLIKELQAILVSNDLEEHFKRGNTLGQRLPEA